MQSLLFSFQGRLNRSKFWLVHIALWVVIVIVFGAVLGGAAMSSDPQAALASVGLVGGLVLAVVYILAIWIPRHRGRSAGTTATSRPGGY
jgi:uncharacterized membrane protein YhaH (DUF805 family)